MYISRDGFSCQRGIALLLSLLILMVLTLLGISAFHNSHIQERSAGNMRLQSVAFEAAASGAVDAINFFDAYKATGPDANCGELDHDGWNGATAWVTRGSVGEATVKQRMYCLADEYPSEGPCEENAWDCRPARSQLFVLSRGEITSGGQVVAQRDIEVRLDIGGGGGINVGCGAICFPGCNPGTFNFPTSNAFRVDGNGGPAITGACQGMRDGIRNGVSNNRIGNYVGGIHATTPESAWETPESTELFRTNLETSAVNAQAAGECMVYCFRSGNAYEYGTPQFGTIADPQITYITGSAWMGGDVSGAGILVVQGNLSWEGTPQFRGLILVLGGSFTIAGGGSGGQHAGSVVILNRNGNNGSFGVANFYNEGGGNALYRYDCAALWDAHALLDANGQSMWAPECVVGPASPYTAAPDELIIASWRENIGWREEFFGSN